MQELENALERIKPYVLEGVGSPDLGGELYRGPSDHGYFNGERKCQIARLRLDWELSLNSFGPTDVNDPLLPWLEATKEGITDLMVRNIYSDLEDLIVNGDTLNGTDALLKTIDGEKKRGQRVSMVDIFSVNMYKEFKPMRDSIEYTLFVLMAVDFEDND